MLPCRCADRDARVFFHFSEARFAKVSVVEGAEVSFLASLGEADGRPIAKNLQLLAPGSIAASYEQEIPGANLDNFPRLQRGVFIVNGLWNFCGNF